MKKTAQTLWRIVQHNVTGLCLLASLLAQGQSAYAVTTITIGKGSGVVWEGMPFNVTNNAILGTSDAQMNNSASLPLAYISALNTWLECLSSSDLTTIAGYQAIKIAPGVGLLPRANINASYVLADGSSETLTGTIGLPNTKGSISPSGSSITSPPGYAWCLAPRMTEVTNFYKMGSTISATAIGSWVMVADGTQTSQNNITLPFYSSFWTKTPAALLNQLILPSNISLRISTLECTVNTPVQIDFGAVAKNTQSGAELGSKTNTLTTQCSQDSTRGINANINVQFRALTGLYGGTPSRLALSQGGGYITGEISGGVTGSGSCSATSGVPFDNTQLKVGNITSVQSTNNTTNQITWRLCSGGSDLPTGNVSASTEMLVTFN
ncbi:adhesin [Serratia oryzae]|uniref:adhesin n=1 Tax=Serratia oryzae TaxID=2034155 RepID=UPI001FC99B4A|nr:adhesin [Serratia oryzae]